MSTIQLAVNDVACTGCIAKIRKGIKRLNGVEAARIVAGSGRLQIDFNERILNQEKILQQVQHLSFRAFD